MGKRQFDRISGNSISKHETSLAGHNECFFLISFITLSEIWFQRNSSFTCPSFWWQTRQLNITLTTKNYNNVNETFIVLHCMYLIDDWAWLCLVTVIDSLFLKKYNGVITLIQNGQTCILFHVVLSIHVRITPILSIALKLVCNQSFQ